MPVSRKKPPTLTSDASTQQSPSPALPEQEAFRQHLRCLAVSAVQVLIKQMMREEVEPCIGASWGEITANRRGSRNGSYTRDLVTSTGRMEDLNVPRDREGVFPRQVFGHDSHSEPEVAEALTQLCVSGTSTHTVGEETQTLMGVAPSARAVSRLTQARTQPFEA
jgi:transposase-like protein